MSTSDVGCCGHHLHKAHLEEFLCDAIGWVLHKAEVEIASDESWPAWINDRYQSLKKEKDIMTLFAHLFWY